MKHTISCSPEYAMATVNLDQDEKLVVEAGAMVAMSGNMQVETSTRGGALSALKRSVLGGESFFVNKYHPEGGGGEISIAPPTPGDIIHMPMDGTMIVQKGSFIACEDSIQIDTKFQGLKGFFSGEGLFMLRASGKGNLFVSSYGAIHEVDVDGTYKVDNGYIVAFEESLTYNIQRLGGMKSFLLGGEALVCEFMGKGKLWIQTRSPQQFAAWIHPFRRVQQKNN